ncbi:hypothetical protein D3C85_1531320 [compost metagenome]
MPYFGIGQLFLAGMLALAMDRAELIDTARLGDRRIADAREFVEVAQQWLALRIDALEQG